MKTDYQTVFSRARLTVFALALAATFSLPGFASEEVEFRRTAGESSVYLAVTPAEIITGPQPASELGATPYQPPAAKDTHHVMVSKFEYRTGRSVTDAAVAARVAALGFSGTKKTLETTTVAGTPVYAGLFPMQGRGPFRGDVEFRVATAARPEHATFYFTHPSFAEPKQKKREERKRR